MKKKKRKIFYKVYFAYILLFFVFIAAVMVKLNSWLRDYEASQPSVKADAVFAELFETPDWRKIYDLSGTEDTVFEGRDAYAAYMTKKTGGAPLNLIQTSAGLSGDKKYFVRCGEEKLLSFMLFSIEPAEEGGITTWEPGEFELMYSNRQAVQVLVHDDCTVFINGVALDDTYTIQRSATLAENYLPEGIHGERWKKQCVESLLVPPEVKAVNAAGEELTLNYNAESSLYTQERIKSELTDAEKAAIEKTAQEYSKYMIGVPVKLASYFDTDSEIYRVIRGNESWIQDNTGCEFSEAVFSNCYRYTDELFSARVELVMSVKRGNGSIKEYKVESDFFMEKQDNGGWLAVNMLNENAQQTVTEVRLVCSDGTQVLADAYVASDSSRLELPAVSVPKGQTFLGWAKEEVDTQGRKSMVLMFAPDEDGVVVLPENYVLEPMTLYPLFE